MDLSDLYSKKTRLVKMLVFRSLCPKKKKELLLCVSYPSCCEVNTLFSQILIPVYIKKQKQKRLCWGGGGGGFFLYAVWIVNGVYKCFSFV